MRDVISVVRVKDQNGDWIGIPAIKGERGAPGGEGAVIAEDTYNDGNVVMSYQYLEDEP